MPAFAETVTEPYGHCDQQTLGTAIAFEHGVCFSGIGLAVLLLLDAWAAAAIAFVGVALFFHAGDDRP